MPDQLESPASPLANLLIEAHKLPELLILSSPSGTGKTNWCLKLADQAQAAGLVVGGLVSPAVFVGGRKVGIDLMDLSTGGRRSLAVLREAGEGGLLTYRWQLNTAVLAWGNRLLEQHQTYDLLILDELGLLEFDRGQGLQAGLALVDGRQMPCIFAVVRLAVLNMARKRWPWAKVLTLSAGQKSINTLGAKP